MSDRILVMREGSITGELAGAEATQAHVMHLAVGGQGKSLSTRSGRRPNPRPGLDRRRAS